MPKRKTDAARKSTSTPARIAAVIREAIFRGELLPGDPVLETHQAELHRVSQTTVREALLQLEHAGLVRRVRNIGTLVTQISQREIHERIRLRIVLETMAVKEVIRVARPEDLDRIEASFESLERAVGGQDYFETSQADLEFHRVVWQVSGDGTLYQILDQLAVPLFAFSAMEERRIRHPLTDALLHRHAPIVKAARERDRAAAESAIQTHFEVFYPDYLGSRPGNIPATAEQSSAT